MSNSNTTLSAADRLGTHSAKWDLLAAPFGDDAISLSVADIEFETAPAVSRAVAEAASGANFGYTEVFDDYFEAAANWQASRYGWEVDAQSGMFFPRIIEAVAAVLSWRTRECGRPLRVVTLAPHYSPILEVVGRWGAQVVPVGLDFSTTAASVDFAALGEALVGADVLLWCNPHNPSGRVWREEELAQVAQLALANNVLVISDDIHADFTADGHQYTPIAKVAPQLWDAGLLLACSSPGKTFAMAGLEAAVVFAGPELLAALGEEKRRLGLHNPNFFAIPAAIAAWTEGAGWAQGLRERVNENLKLSRETLLAELPALRIAETEGTFLQWVDASAYLTGPVDIEWIQKESRVLVTPGEDFGPGYETYFRINAATPTPMLLAGLKRLIRAIQKLNQETLGRTTMKISEKLAEMGLELPAVAAPVAAYVPALAQGGVVRTSGQLPMKDGDLVCSGSCGDGRVSIEAAQVAAKQCALNALAAAADVVGGVDNLTNAVKLTGFVSSAPGFFAQPAVINAASEMFEELFGASHIRSAVGVVALPLNATVEIEVEFTTTQA